MKIKETLAAAGAALVVLFVAAWLMSETKMLALQDIDKEFVNYQVSAIQRSVDEIHLEAEAFNERLESLEKLNSTLIELNSHLESVGDIREGATKIYEEMADILAKEFRRLDQNLTQMHADQLALLDTIKKLGKRLSPFIGNDD